MDDLQDIARSSYADMLHDDERNHAYFMALRANIAELVKSNEHNPSGDRHFHCGDIGTGSGLLSMMIVKSFRDLNYQHFHVTSYEAFGPMAECAKKVITTNGMAANITVIAGRAEDHKLPEDQRFDLLVAELLDTEVIGEGCLMTYLHVQEYLCKSKCLYVPQAATVWVQVLGSEELHRRNSLRSNKYDTPSSVSIEYDLKWNSCQGMVDVDDMQLSQVAKRYKIREVSPCYQDVFRFDFSDTVLNEKRTIPAEFRDGLGSTVIAMWWDIEMYDEKLYGRHLKQDDGCPHSFARLSCGPSWFRDANYRERDEYIERTYGRKVWREHWIQGLYHYTRGPPQECAGKHDIYAYHDAYSLWFSSEECRSNTLVPTCDCGFHRAVSRSEIAFLNSEYLYKMLDAICRHDGLQPRVKLDFNVHRSDVASNVPPFEQGQRYRAIFMDEEVGGPPGRVYNIDYSLQADVAYARVMENFISGKAAKPFVGLDIVCAQVCFENLNRIRTKVGHCQGFDLSHLDDLVEEAARLVDASTESHHLIEYEFQEFPSEPRVILLSLDGREALERRHWEKQLTLNIPAQLSRDRLKKGWALIFWADFRMTNGLTLPGGHDRAAGAELRSETMQPHCKQLVHFLHDHRALEDESCSKIKLDIVISTEGIRVAR